MNVVVSLSNITNENRSRSDNKAMIDRLLLEKNPLAGIAGLMQVSEAWLQRYVNAFDRPVLQQVEVTKPQPRLRVQIDVCGISTMGGL
ncbi:MULTISPECIES: hypothetical protein [unclassified Microcoleus]|uniref:hypothetical protein n=1 Tax=unclassified Microcoleus TaxID=2642155 RepID=UPI00404098D9